MQLVASPADNKQVNENSNLTLKHLHDLEKFSACVDSEQCRANDAHERVSYATEADHKEYKYT